MSSVGCLIKFLHWLRHPVIELTQRLQDACPDSSEAMAAISSLKSFLSGLKSEELMQALLGKLANRPSLQTLSMTHVCGKPSSTK